MNQAILKLLEELVNIDSGTGDLDGLVKQAQFLQTEFNSMQFEFQTQVASDGSRHYYAKKGQGDLILLIAHLDTVFPKGTVQSRKFKIDGDTATGPGVSDCKSGVVTIIGAMNKLSKMQWPDCEIGCLFNTDEEIGSPGSRAIIERLARRAKLVLVVEPAEGENLTVARKGIGRFTLRVFGKAAHAGSNFLDGSNAILELSHKVLALHDLNDLVLGVTLNVGIVSGGVRPNVIPDYAAAEVDVRFPSANWESKLITALETIAETNLVTGTSAKLSGGITRPAMPVSPENLKLYNLVKQVGQTLGMELGIFKSGGGSDANFTAALGIPTLDGLGPSGGGHHSADEYLSVPSLFQRIDLLAEFLKQLPILEK